MIAFASCFPGSIRAFNIRPGQEMIFQKSAFLASEAGVQLSVHFHKKVASGLFGGEGFVLQKVSGQGVAFAEFDGHVVVYELQPGQQIVIDTGHLAAMTASCQMDIQTVPGVRTSGCSGMAYVLEFVDEPAAEDTVFEDKGVKVVIDGKSLQFLDGTQLDFVKEGLNEGFKFTNPNVKDECGCGESFNV